MVRTNKVWMSMMLLSSLLKLAQWKRKVQCMVSINWHQYSRKLIHPSNAKINALLKVLIIAWRRVTLTHLKKVSAAPKMHVVIVMKASVPVILMIWNSNWCHVQHKHVVTETISKYHNYLIFNLFLKLWLILGKLSLLIKFCFL